MIRNFNKWIEYDIYFQRVCLFQYSRFFVISRNILDLNEIDLNANTKY